MCVAINCLSLQSCPVFTQYRALCSLSILPTVLMRLPLSSSCNPNTASYAIGGGLLSVVYTDVVMSVTGIIGLALCAIGIIASTNTLTAPPSIGFPG